MEDLTGKFPAALVPSSMNPGNTTADAPNLAMTAPGSPSVNPIHETPDNLPLPVFSQAQIPVSNAKNKPAVPRPGGSFGEWADKSRASGPWKVSN